MTSCPYTIAMAGPCGRQDCAEHAAMPCHCCGTKATHECAETFGGCVCGTPLCDDCEHLLTSAGTNAPALVHCRKGEQAHAPAAREFAR
ncbi:hypothetical protein ATO13_22181 [Stappia sp. 22II-S9-Z10]|nr:hypothetical protein ATO13_22181 [Stappia sp. 22II-S9-Z10]